MYVRAQDGTPVKVGTVQRDTYEYTIYEAATNTYANVFGGYMTDGQRSWVPRLTDESRQLLSTLTDSSNLSTLHFSFSEFSKRPEIIPSYATLETDILGYTNIKLYDDTNVEAYSETADPLELYMQTGNSDIYFVNRFSSIGYRSGGVSLLSSSHHKYSFPELKLSLFSGAQNIPLRGIAFEKPTYILGLNEHTEKAVVTQWYSNTSAVTIKPDTLSVQDPGMVFAEVGDTHVASVDPQTGKITPHHIGTTYLKATYNNQTAFAKIKVNADDWDVDNDGAVNVKDVVKLHNQQTNAHGDKSYQTYIKNLLSQITPIFINADDRSR